MKPELIVMLTHHDVTVKNAIEIFEECKDTKARYWGFKETGLPFAEMKKLCRMMKEAGKTTFLEVVAYTEEKCLEGAKMAGEGGFDYLLGTTYFDSVCNYAKERDLKYLPCVGKVSGRPSVLEGTIEGIVAEAKELLKKDVYGFDLPGYRFVGDSVKLNNTFVREVKVPVCLAGSIDSYKRLDEVKVSGSWTFTIGGAFFENKFEGSFAEQIDKVVDYMEM